ncbi:unnamed protein product [Gongylonema pulchrum]|uniref:ACB domain-containing protein n=1 Tax=Gongylonema pulchrum TaxID=637853 RepID=A0A3P7MY65_9BILA|nr:unnamed protein product [Gongylonema pulchrum]
MFFRFKSWEADFNQSVEKVKQLKREPDIPTKLKLYGLYKQATIGDVEGKRPFLLSPAQAKFDAWKEYKGKSKDEAQQMYVEFVNSFLMMETKAEAATAPEGLEPVPGLDVTLENKLCWIKLNRPNKYNALTWEMYNGITNALNYANGADTTVTAITGTGDYFCSGNDLSNFTKVKSPEDLPRMASDAGKLLRDYVDAYINHKKALVALVNGPAIGIAVTVLPLFDLVVASDKMQPPNQRVEEQ